MKKGKLDRRGEKEKESWNEGSKMEPSWKKEKEFIVEMKSRTEREEDGNREERDNILC